MGVRRQSREWALQFLFQRDFNREGDLAAELEEFWRDRRPAPRVQSFTEEIIYNVERQRDELDAKINEYTEHWDVKRMGGVDRNLLRIALYEMTGRSDIPPVVSIDEAVEIAKRYSSNESGRFVNGILDRARKDLKRRSSKPAPATQSEKGTDHGHLD